MEIVATYGHALLVSVDGTPTIEWRYYEQEVYSKIALSGEIFTEPEMDLILGYVDTFKNRLESVDWLSVPIGGLPVSPDHTAERSWPTADEVKLEISIDTTTFELTFDKITRTYSIEVPAFVLSWCDFCYILRDWKEFVDDMSVQV